MLLFKRSKPDKEALHDPREHEMREIVVVCLPDRLEADVTDLEESLCATISQSDLGFYGGTEQEGNEVALYFYGPLAEPIFAALKPALLTHSDTANAHIKLATGFGATRVYTNFPLIP